MDLIFPVYKLEKFSENSGKLHFERIVHLLIYIRDNKTLGLKYYGNINDALVSDLLIKASIKTENHLMDFSYSSWQYCPDSVRGTRSYIILYQGGPIYHGTHVPGPFAQSIVESDYNAACTAGMDLAHFIMLFYDF